MSPFTLVPPKWSVCEASKINKLSQFFLQVRITRSVPRVSPFVWLWWIFLDRFVTETVRATTFVLATHSTHLASFAVMPQNPRQPIDWLLYLIDHWFKRRLKRHQSVLTVGQHQHAMSRFSNAWWLTSMHLLRQTWVHCRCLPLTNMKP